MYVLEGKWSVGSMDIFKGSSVKKYLDLIGPQCVYRQISSHFSYYMVRLIFAQWLILQTFEAKNVPVTLLPPRDRV